MRHARPEDLNRIEPLLAALRELAGMTEKKRGVFTIKSKSLLHFHEDREGMFADLSLGESFTRHRVSTAAERKAFLKIVRKRLQRLA
jgi:hypothetical protein